MAFTVEDGSGSSTANAYIGTAEFTAHHDDRGIDYSSYDTAAQEDAIVQATDYADKRFGKRFRGWRTSQAQALEWPRSDAYDDDDHVFDDVPRQLKRAIAEYALLALQLGRNLAPMPGAGFPIVDPATGGTTQQGGGTITEQKEKVGPIETMVKFGDSGKPVVSSGNILTQNVPEYPQADLWIEELLTSILNKDMGRG